MSQSTAYFVREYKLAVMGDGGVGKSALITRLLGARFEEDYNPTLEDSYRQRCIVDDEVADLDILDTAGQEDYKSMRELYIRDREGFILVYSITSRDSVGEVIQLYDEIRRIKEQQYVPILLVGNKSDLEFQRQVSTSDGRSLAQYFNCQLIETSAKYRINVEEAFYALVRDIRQYNRREQLSRTVNVPRLDDSTPGENESCCRCVIA
ncbi:hypothetical protein M422DRAFT_239391 [Sphaerobolus stellatus SS14]|nr:hypothetical protein M422DRAFT_239391 [Sphaerobolus stellatus SS14]